ncbi:hypothetical protein [Actibacterium ureilyticum]|uniref:hypothetical protein n=1 Tax=Actibacterium ureilyticum TaxID=1590614 RepID=UPI001140C265|nr:hypothetical protein [Actibacterium ureilyticum]
MKAIRIVLICVILVAMGGIGLSQVNWDELDLKSKFSMGDKQPKTIRSASTGSRVGADKTIKIKQEKPGLWTQIMMFFGWEPEDAHMAQLEELKKQRARDAARMKGVNQVTGRKESTASSSSSSNLKSKSHSASSLADRVAK